MRVAQFRNESGSMPPALRLKGSVELFRSMVGTSAGIREVRNRVGRMAPLGVPVMLLGETGTGKEVVARNIHRLSNRCNKPFVAIDCAALPGGPRKLSGAFLQAAGGTIFLDGVGDIEPRVQGSLECMLRDRLADRSGVDCGFESEVRVIAATHRDLQAMAAEGRFSAALCAGLTAARILLPALRERREDIPLLVSEIRARLAGRGLLSGNLSDRALRALLAYDWPGNVRELAFLLERCAIAAQGKDIGIEDLPKRIRGTMDAAYSPVPISDLNGTGDIGPQPFGKAAIELRGLLELLETRLVRQALAKSGGAIAPAANRLGLRQASLIEKMQEFGIDGASR